MDFSQQDSTSCQMLQRASLPPGWRKTYHPTSTSRHFGSRPERSTHTLVRVLDCLEKQSSNQTSHYTITTLITADKIDRTIECLIQLGVRPCTLPRQPLRLTGGMAQGTLLGPLIFPAVIDSTAWDFDSRWKYVDNLDLVHTWTAGNISAPQLAVDNMWVQPSRASLTLARNPPVPCPLPIAGQELQVLDNVKILGVIVQKDPQWSEQVASMATKCSNKFVFK